MSHYFSNVFQPEGIASVFGQLLVVGISLFTTCHAVETELKVSSQVSLAVVDVPGCIRIACLTGQKIGKGQTLAVGYRLTFVPVAESGAHGAYGEGVEQGFSGILIPRVFQEVCACEVREQAGYIIQCMRICSEVSCTVMPFSVAVEARCRSTCGPYLIAVFQHFACRFIPVGKHQANLQHLTEAVLPVVVVEDVRLFIAGTLYHVMAFGYFENHLFHLPELLWSKHVMTGIVRIQQAFNQFAGIEVILP